MATADGLLDVGEVEIRSWVEALRGELARVGEQLAQAENALSRMEITRSTLAEVVGGSGEGPVAAVLAALRAQQESLPREVASAGRVAGSPAVVPMWRQDLTEAHLPADYRQLWVGVRDAHTPPRVRELTRVVGLADTAAKREGVRSKLKRLVSRGWAARGRPGLLQCRRLPRRRVTTRIIAHCVIASWLACRRS